MKLSEDGLILIRVTDDDIQNGTFEIPNSVTHIGDHAFCDCASLTQIILSNSVTHIGDCAFAYCTSLPQVTLPNSVTHIGDCAFAYCANLPQITLPNSVTHIGVEAFVNCARLIQITIPNSVTHIGRSAFDDCPNLIAIFIDCSNLQDFERISRFIGDESKPYILPYSLCCEISKAKEQALGLMQPIGMNSFPPALIETLVNHIQQMDGSLQTVIKQAPLPHNLDELEQYKHDLARELNAFKAEQESKPQKITATDKLRNYIQITQETITKAKNKNPSFFDNDAKRLKLEETQARIAVVNKLIKWLGGDEPISFTENERALISNTSVAMILANSGIYLYQLPIDPVMPTEDGSGNYI